MDVETAESIQTLIRMIDNVNERNSLGRIAFNGTIVLLCSARRQGTLSAQETKHIDDLFSEMAVDAAIDQYPKVKTTFETAKQMWEVSKPR